MSTLSTRKRLEIDWKKTKKTSMPIQFHAVGSRIGCQKQKENFFLNKFIFFSQRCRSLVLSAPPPTKRRSFFPFDCFFFNAGT